MSNSQKVAIVTGASQGIGAEIVKGFRERGYRVVAVGVAEIEADLAGALDRLAGGLLPFKA